MASFKKLFYFSLPASLLVFIFFQNFTPLFQPVIKTADPASVATVPVKLAAKPEAVSDLSKLKQGIYYAYKADYSCIHPHSPKGPAIPSQLDSYGISDGKICHLGDLCNDSVTCSTTLPAGVKITKDSQLKINGREFRWQENSYPAECTMPGCSAPPGDCRYSVAAPLDSHGCALGCGSMLCKGNPENCPELECAVPPANCSYDGQGSRDANNCPISCGRIVCDIVGEDVSCPKLDCAKPPENCHYDRDFKTDSKGCKITCGNLTCDRPRKDKPVCKIVECAMPPPGCNYEGAPPLDEDGCITSCGSLACAQATPAKCKVPKCDRPPVNCRYDGNSPLDFEGCSSGCGNLICNIEEPTKI